ncbi:hypothetical protein [Bowmanella dokdonensis]|uniref:Uncharacterized protein n=1 Tax=Bowmanella dokdonensis TaxID=751969 RepID=A0A939DL23_9ALTE|nr:hypothetical protein [Bowmanella dokdonensis]MBN7824140.1 hypothetical protein [Bowmanella dokdonensis]
MFEHGAFKLKVEGRVLHTFPEGSFNQPGLVKYRQAVLDEVAGLSGWVLFEHPRNIAAVTNDALTELIDTYRQAQFKGCLGVACEVGAPFDSIISARLDDSIEMPVCFSQDEEQLRDFVSQLLSASF